MPSSRFYADFSPPGQTGKRFYLVPGDLDPTDIIARRVHMNAFFCYMQPDAPLSALVQMHDKASTLACETMNQWNLTIVGRAAFEYAVDHKHWVDWFKELDKKGYPTPEWPWAAYRPKHDDMKDGRSATYDEWLKAARIARIQRIIPPIDELEDIDMGPVDYGVSEAEDGSEDEAKGEAKGEAARQ
ncbi:hypothetical protein EDB80DRAFT_894805 [Ilyonectria destructans]|nr:hypothetical protein EDB80DRAFT_894805 [Ilyonectria destructans]